MTSRYASDLTDKQWDLIGHLLTNKYQRIGRPRTVSVRRVFDAIFYVLDNGIKWRNLPHDFPNWRTCYGYYEAWRKSEKLRYIQKVLQRKVRVAAGLPKHPSTARIDSQSVKTSKMSATEYHGYDGGKRVKGRKRHLAVDSLGFPLSILVTKANVQDKKVSRFVLSSANRFNGKRGFEKVYADGGYASKDFKQWCKDKLGAELIISKNLTTKETGFIPVAQRWVVERSFAWLLDCRRLVVDHERHPASSQAMIRLRFIWLMLKRLTK